LWFFIGYWIKTAPISIGASFLWRLITQGFIDFACGKNELPQKHETQKNTNLVSVILNHLWQKKYSPPLGRVSKKS
jgi:hypothetical protein